MTAACSEEGFFPAKLWHSSNPLRGSFPNWGCCHPKAQLVEPPPPGHSALLSRHMGLKENPQPPGSYLWSCRSL